MRSFVLALALSLFVAVPAAHAQSANVAGEWNASMNTPGGSSEYKVLFVVKGDSLTGTVKRRNGDAPLTGTIKGNDLSFAYVIEYGGNAITLTVAAKVDGDAMKGSIDLNGGAVESWSAKRAAPSKP